jgi:hypothetical protein
MRNRLVTSSQILQFHILNTYISICEAVWGNAISTTYLAAEINKHFAQVQLHDMPSLWRMVLLYVPSVGHWAQ